MAGSGIYIINMDEENNHPHTLSVIGRNNMKYLNDAILSKALKAAEFKGTPGTRSYRSAVTTELTKLLSEEYDNVKSSLISDKGVVISFNNSPDKIIPLSFRQFKNLATKLFGKDTDEYREFMSSIR